MSENPYKKVIEKVKNLSDSIREFFGLETRKEKEFTKRFPKTPYFIGASIEDYIKSLKAEDGLENKEKKSVEMVLADIGLYFRRAFIDFAHGGDSKNFCFEFSVRLRDIYNYIFKTLHLPNEALLVSGSFGKKEKSNHAWVAIIEKSNVNLSAAELKEIVREKSIIVDGTVDQYKNWYGLSAGDQGWFGLEKLLIIPADDKLTQYYSQPIISPVPASYFVEKIDEPQPLGENEKSPV